MNNWRWRLYFLIHLVVNPSSYFLTEIIPFHCVSHRSFSAIQSPPLLSSAFPRRATAVIWFLQSSSTFSRIWTFSPNFLSSSNFCMVPTMWWFGQIWIWFICDPSKFLMLFGTSVSGNPLVLRGSFSNGCLFLCFWDSVSDSTFGTFCSRFTLAKPAQLIPSTQYQFPLS